MAPRLTLNKEERQALGPYVKSLRELAGVTQRALAKNFNIPPSRINSIESGKTSGLEDGLLQKIFDRFGGGDVNAYVLGLRMRNTREEQGLSSVALAENTGTTVGFIDTIENGSMGRQLQFLGKTLGALKVKHSDVLVKRLLGFVEGVDPSKEHKEDVRAKSQKIQGNTPHTLFQDMQRSPCSLMVMEPGALFKLDSDHETFSDLVRVLKAGHQRWYFVPIEEWGRKGSVLLERLELHCGSLKNVRNKLRVYGVTTNLFYRLQMNLYLSLDYNDFGAGVVTLGEDAYALPRHIVGAGVYYFKEIAEELDEKMKHEDNRYLVVECFHRFF